MPPDPQEARESVTRLVAALLVVAALAISPVTGAEDGGDEEVHTGAIEVNAVGFESNRGTARFLLFDSAKTFAKRPAASAIRPVRQRKASTVFEDLPYGTYVVVVYHEEIGDGFHYDMRARQPTRKVGFSNDAWLTTGPPTFEDAAVELDSETLALTIKIRR